MLQTLFTATDGLVDESPTHRSLARSSFVSKHLSRPMGNVDRSISVTVNQHAALTGEPETISTASFPATGTGLASVSRVYGDNIQTVLPSDTLQCSTELSIGHPLDFTVTFPAQLALVQVLEVFNSNGRIMLQRQPHDLVGNLVTTCVGVVRLIPSDFPQGSPSPRGISSLEYATPNSQITFNLIQILSEIQLPDGSVFRHDTDCGETIHANVHADNITFDFYFEVLLEHDRQREHPTTAIETELCKGITLREQVLEPYITPILFNRNANISHHDNGIMAVSLFEPATTRHVESNGLVLERFHLFDFALLHPDLFARVNDQLTMQIIQLTDTIITETLQREFTPDLLGLKFGEISITSSNISSYHRVQEPTLLECGFAQVQPDGSDNCFHGFETSYYLEYKYKNGGNEQEDCVFDPAGYAIPPRAKAPWLPCSKTR